MRHNSGIPKKTSKKHWQRHVKTWFDKPMKKVQRAKDRKAKAEALGKRPLYKLRPVVNCLSNKYDERLRLGRGFTMKELEGAGVDCDWAATYRVSVDKRRKDKNEETLNRNVERLNLFKDSLVVMKNKDLKKMSEEDKSNLKKSYGACSQMKDKCVIPFSRYPNRLDKCNDRNGYSLEFVSTSDLKEVEKSAEEKVRAIKLKSEEEGLKRAKRTERIKKKK